jgi:hypothetical protein
MNYPRTRAAIAEYRRLQEAGQAARNNETPWPTLEQFVAAMKAVREAFSREGGKAECLEEATPSYIESIINGRGER